MGLNCTNPGGCRFPKGGMCLASCSFTWGPEDDEAFRKFQRDRIEEARKHDAEQAKPRLVPSSPSIEREAAAPSIEVPPGMSRIDAFFWLEHRADVIEALAQKGLRVVSNADRVWLAPIEREVSGEGGEKECLTDEQAEALIEASEGHWREDVFCIGGPELMALLRAASCVTPCDGGKNG